MDNSYIGVDIGGTNITAACIQGNTILGMNSIPTPAQGTFPQVLDAISYVIQQVWNPDIKAIGLGSPGYMLADEGIILTINNIPGLQGINLKEEVSKLFQVPVFLNNDANCFALGVAHFGAGKGFRNIVGLTLGTGLGAGIVLNGKIYGGLYGGSGELGCLPYLDGNIEDYCASRFFENTFSKSGSELYTEALQGELQALEAFCEYGIHLANLIDIVMYTYAPDLIALGGSISKAFPYFKHVIQDKIQQFPVEIIRNNVHVSQSVLENAALYGAVALCK